MNRPFKRIGWGLGVFSLLVIAWLLGTHWLASSAELTVDQAWIAATGLSPAELYSQAVSEFPASEGNQVVLHLRQLARRLGVANGSPMLSISFDYLHDQMLQTSDELDEPPEELSRFLAKHKDDLQALYALLSQAELPRWRTDLGRFVAAHYPNKFFIRALQRTVALDILAKTYRQEHSQALAAFQALWKINDSLRRRPELLTKRMGVELAFYPHGVLRKMNGVPAPWPKDRPFSDGPTEILQACALEAALTSRMAGDGPYYPEMNLSPLKRLLFTPFGRPLLRYRIAKLSDLASQIVAQLKAADVCTFDPERGRAQFTHAVRRERLWHGLENKLWPWLDPGHFHSYWKDCVRAMLDMELTQEVLYLKEVKASSEDPDWLKKLPHHRDSELCDQLKWVLQVSQGNLIIRPTGLPAWVVRTPRTHWQLPLRYSLKVGP